MTLTKEEPANGKTSRRRAATEAALIAAFDRVVQRSGLRSVGVNEVINEAGVGKALLYRYFGGLPGLVRAWGNSMKIWPDMENMRELVSSVDANDPAELVKRLVMFHAESLRNDPLRVEMLAEQFMRPTPISEALEEIRVQRGYEYYKIFDKHLVYEKHLDLLRLMMGAVSYMAMRAATAPVYMGENLGSQDVWDERMRQFEELIDAALEKSDD